MLLIVLSRGLFAARRLIRLRLLRLGGQIFRVLCVTEQLVEERERRRLAFIFLVVAVVVRLRLVGEHALQTPERVGHLAVEVFQILVGDAHALHQVVHRPDAELLGAFETQALVDGIAVFDFGDEDHRQIFLTS